MQQARNRLILVFAVSSLLASLAGILFITVVAVEASHSVVSNDSSGLSELYMKYNGQVIYAQSELANYREGYTLLVIPRAIPLQDISKLNNFVERGGLVVAYGSPEHIVNLLRSLGVNASLKGYVRTGLPAYGSGFHVPGNIHNTSVVFRNPYTMSGNIKVDHVIAWSSYLSYLDLDGDSLYDLEEPIGPQILGLEISIGKGKYIILFTEFFLENDVLEYNTHYIDRLLENRELVIDQSEHVSNTLVYLKLIMETRSSPMHIYVYLALVAFTILVAYVVVRE